MAISRFWLGLGFLIVAALLFALQPRGGASSRRGQLPSRADLLRSLEDAESDDERDYPVVASELSPDELATAQDVVEVDPTVAVSSEIFIGSDGGQAHAVDATVGPYEGEKPMAPEGIFEDQEEYDAAPFIVPPRENARYKTRLIVLEHERFYRVRESRLYVPRLRRDVQLSLEEFAERFIFGSQPVIVPFECMRHLGFEQRAFTLDQLLEIYPNHKPAVYKFGSRTWPHDADGELDLGPAVAALQRNENLRKGQGGRNFPRNMKVSKKWVAKLGLEDPPYLLPGTTLMQPSLWFAATTSSTKMHSDCCDNYAMMVAGTKRWTVAPPSEARLLQPKCTGGLCWVKQLEHPDEHAKTPREKQLAAKVQKTTFDLRPGEMLFLPTGWFHHVENLDPTVMLNYWTRGGPAFLKFIEHQSDPSVLLHAGGDDVAREQA